MILSKQLNTRLLESCLPQSRIETLPPLTPQTLSSFDLENLIQNSAAVFPHLSDSQKTLWKDWIATTLASFEPPPGDRNLSQQVIEPALKRWGISFPQSIEETS